MTTDYLTGFPTAELTALLGAAFMHQPSRVVLEPKPAWAALAAAVVAEEGEALGEQRTLGRQRVTVTRRTKNRAYVKGISYTGNRRSTWRIYMVRLVQEHDCTAAAETAHKASDLYNDEHLDWGWLERKGFIYFEGSDQ